jgi:peptide/nickel transport system substrate-binding protein
VNNLAPKLESANTYAAEINFLTNSPLVVLEPRGAARPLLAAELPSRERGSWVVNPDGTMRTVWRIRPGARWHDGQPVSSRDFVFTLRVYHDNAVPSRDRLPERYMERIEPLDDGSFTIHWSQPYPWANELILHQLAPLPAHVLGALYDTASADAFLAHPFWASPAYVGNGPFRLVQWDPGSQMVFQAYADYFLGRPPLDEVILRIVADDGTLVASVLAGAIDATLGSTLDQQGGATVRQQWAQSGEGTVIITSTNFRHLRFQHDAAKNRQPALLDARVRRAIAHAIDRGTLAEVVSEGSSRATDIPLIPTDPLYTTAGQAIARYPYDPARALALLEEVGWTRRADGLLAGSSGGFAVDLREGQGADTEAEGAIVAADLGKIGMQVAIELIPQSRIRDLEYRASFPGMASGSLPVGLPRALDFGSSAQCANAERRYAGVNRGCWTNPEFDRMYDTVTTALDPAARADALIRALRIVTEEVGVIGLAYQTQAFAVRNGLVGPVSRWPSQSGSTWNIHEWRWE